MTMNENIIVCGLNGTGKSTFGKLLAVTLGCRHKDAEDYYFPEQKGTDYRDPSSGNPYEKSRTGEECAKLLLRDLRISRGFVFSSCDGDFGEEVSEKFTSAVLLAAPKEVRMQRIRKRGEEKFGQRILPGGDLYEQEEIFFRRAEDRDESRVEKWLAGQRIPVIRLDGTEGLMDNLRTVILRMDERERIRSAIFQHRDEKYADFQKSLIPEVQNARLLGVRTPDLRALAKSLLFMEQLQPGTVPSFLSDLPHYYFDEDQLHAFLISEEKDFERCLHLTEAFLPFVNNWATCDQLSPKAFRKSPERLLPAIRRWMESGKTYMIRFAMGCLMRYFLDDRFDPAYPEMVASVHSEEYYVRMMAAWYFATALSKQYDAVLPYLKDRRLDPWTHRKTIQKAVESRRITEEQKACLRTLK